MHPRIKHISVILSGSDESPARRFPFHQQRWDVPFSKTIKQHVHRFHGGTIPENVIRLILHQPLTLFDKAPHDHPPCFGGDILTEDSLYCFHLWFAVLAKSFWDWGFQSPRSHHQWRVRVVGSGQALLCHSRCIQRFGKATLNQWLCLLIRNIDRFARQDCFAINMQVMIVVIFIVQSS